VLLRYLQSVVAEVEPAQIDEIQERVDLESFQAAVAHVQVLQSHVRREITPSDRRRPEDVCVEVELERVGRNRVRDRGQTATRAVDDATVSVAETRLGTGRRRQPRSDAPRTSEADQDRHEHAQNDGGDGSRRSHRYRK